MNIIILAGVTIGLTEINMKVGDSLDIKDEKYLIRSINDNHGIYEKEIKKIYYLYPLDEGEDKCPI